MDYVVVRFVSLSSIRDLLHIGSLGLLLLQFENWNPKDYIGDWASKWGIQQCKVYSVFFLSIIYLPNQVNQTRFSIGIARQEVRRLFSNKIMLS